jgi:hypothetical protein
MTVILLSAFRVLILKGLGSVGREGLGILA